ncbi:MAG: DNA polymerase III, partial [Thermoplasmata archaeon]
MEMKNQEIADVFYQIADLLEIKGEQPFRVRAYRRAAQRIETLEVDVEDLYRKGRLRDVPGIGESIARKIEELIETGRLEYLENLKKEVPEELIRLMEIPGVGPKKALVLYKRLGIMTVDQLREACKKGRLRHLEGFGELTERNILRGIEMLERSKGRYLINVAYEDGYR